MEEGSQTRVHQTEELEDHRHKLNQTGKNSHEQNSVKDNSVSMEAGKFSTFEKSKNGIETDNATLKDNEKGENLDFNSKTNQTVVERVDDDSKILGGSMNYYDRPIQDAPITTSTSDVDFGNEQTDCRPMSNPNVGVASESKNLKDETLKSNPNKYDVNERFPNKTAERGQSIGKNKRCTLALLLVCLVAFAISVFVAYYVALYRHGEAGTAANVFTTRKTVQEMSGTDESPRKSRSLLNTYEDEYVDINKITSSNENAEKPQKEIDDSKFTAQNLPVEKEWNKDGVVKEFSSEKIGSEGQQIDNKQINGYGKSMKDAIPESKEEKDSSGNNDKITDADQTLGVDDSHFSTADGNIGLTGHSKNKIFSTDKLWLDRKDSSFHSTSFDSSQGDKVDLIKEINDNEKSERIHNINVELDGAEDDEIINSEKRTKINKIKARYPEKINSEKLELDSGDTREQNSDEISFRPNEIPVVEIKLTKNLFSVDDDDDDEEEAKMFFDNFMSGELSDNIMLSEEFYPSVDSYDDSNSIDVAYMMDSPEEDDEIKRSTDNIVRLAENNTQEKSSATNFTQGNMHKDTEEQDGMFDRDENVMYREQHSVLEDKSYAKDPKRRGVHNGIDLIAKENPEIIGKHTIKIPFKQCYADICSANPFERDFSLYSGLEVKMSEEREMQINTVKKYRNDSFRQIGTVQQKSPEQWLAIEKINEKRLKTQTKQKAAKSSGTKVKTTRNRRIVRELSLKEQMALENERERRLRATENQRNGRRRQNKPELSLKMQFMLKNERERKIREIEKTAELRERLLEKQQMADQRAADRAAERRQRAADMAAERQLRSLERGQSLQVKESNYDYDAFEIPIISDKLTEGQERFITAKERADKKQSKVDDLVVKQHQSFFLKLQQKIANDIGKVSIRKKLKIFQQAEEKQMELLDSQRKQVDEWLKNKYPSRLLRHSLLDDVEKVYSRIDSSNSDLHVKIDEIDSFLAKGDFARAFLLYQKFLNQYPTEERLWYGRALAVNHIAEKNMTEVALLNSIHAYTALLYQPCISNHTFSSTLQLLFDRFKLIRRYDLMHKTMEKLLSDFPGRKDIKSNYVKSLMFARLISTAKKFVTDELLVNPTDPFMQVHLAHILYSYERMYEDSLPFWRAAINSRAPATIDKRFYTNYGDSLQRLGHRAEALVIYERGAELKLFLSSMQRSFHNVDRLISKPIWSTQGLRSWIELREISSSWQDLRKEALNLISLNDTKSVYTPVPGDWAVRGRWLQVLLFDKGNRNEDNCKLCPTACSLLTRYKSLTACTRCQVRYSLLSPGTHILPHSGPTNCRIRSDMSLLDPHQSSLRVKEETRVWTQGEWLSYDDSFEFEMWNNGSDALVLFTVDTWHPGLTQADIANLYPV